MTKINLYHFISQLEKTLSFFISYTRYIFVLKVKLLCPVTVIVTWIFDSVVIFILKMSYISKV